MIAPNDPRWKVSTRMPPIVVLPLRMPDPTVLVTPHELAKKGIHVHGGWVEATEPSPLAKALQDGAQEVKHYQQGHFGSFAEVIALVEWEDPFAAEELYSAVVRKVHSDS